MNSIIECLPESLRGSLLADDLLAVQAVYEEIACEQSKWIAATPYRCPEGCGACCQKFEPDILEVEALYLASWMLSTMPNFFETAIQDPSDGIGCALAQQQEAGWCGVYPARPLICRLFAYAGDRDKQGKARYKACAHMLVVGPRQLDEDAILKIYGLLPPQMSDFSARLSAINPSLADDRTPLREALVKAANKLRFLAALSAPEPLVFSRPDNSDDDNDGGNTPTFPKAS